MRRPIRAVRTLAIVLVAGSLVACAGDPQPTVAPTTTPSVTPTPEPTPVAAPTAPLTGIDLATALTTPSIAVKIDNHPAARPQIGLASADLVFEELVEGGLTRYVAVWQSAVPAEVGPVRSVRPMDPAIVTPFGGIVAYSGGQARFVEAMQSTGLANEIHGQSEFFYRNRRAAPHNVILKAQDAVGANATLAPPVAPFSFATATTPASAAVPGVGGPAASIDARFSPREVRQWSCDAATGRWLRSQNGVADMDDAGVQLGASNVIVLRVDVQNNQDVPETVLVGGGDAAVLSGCSWVAATWSKPAIDAPIQLSLADGTPVVLAQGNSWIELVPTSGSIAVS